MTVETHVITSEVSVRGALCGEVEEAAREGWRFYKVSNKHLMK